MEGEILSEKENALNRRKTLSIHFYGFEIRVGVHLLYEEGESITSDDETFKRGCRYLKIKGVPIQGLHGHEEQVYEIY